jgi:peptidoglycan/LPS O-acetylase OafA/YrhL
MSFTLLACIAFNHVLLTKARPDVLPGLALAENISYILRNVSYFEQIGGPSPLTHLWYLGIDAQFSLVWPLLMTLFAAIMPSRSITRRICLVLAVASAVAMGVLYNPDTGDHSIALTEGRHEAFRRTAMFLESL